MYGLVSSAKEMEDRRGAPVARSVVSLGDTGVGLGGERGEPIPTVGTVVLLLVLDMGGGSGGGAGRSSVRPLPLG